MKIFRQKKITFTHCTFNWSTISLPYAISDQGSLIEIVSFFLLIFSVFSYLAQLSHS